MITTEQIKELRDLTGVSVMQCKKALEEANGDKAQALVLLRKKSSEIASKKADRVLGAGIVQAYVHSSGTIGAIVELSCETDFVAKNDEFKALAYDLAMHVAAVNPQYAKAEDVPEAERAAAADKILGSQPFVKNPELTVTQILSNAVQKFGEKTEVTRFSRFSVLEK